MFLCGTILYNGCWYLQLKFDHPLRTVRQVHLTEIKLVYRNLK